jgi:hypothetical protein
LNLNRIKNILIVSVVFIFVLVSVSQAVEILEGLSDSSDGYIKEGNGVEITEMKIFKYEGQEMIQLRELADEYKWSLYYDPVKKEIILRNRNQTVSLRTVSGKDRGTEGAYPVISEGRTYLPIPVLKKLLEDLGEERVITGLYTAKNVFGLNERMRVFLRLYNFTEETIELDFASGQRYDLYLTKKGQEIWRWSDGRFFTMALAREELKAGEILAFDLDIDPELEAGHYILTGELATIPGRMLLGEIQLEIIED